MLNLRRVKKCCVCPLRHAQGLSLHSRFIHCSRAGKPLNTLFYRVGNPCAISFEDLETYLESRFGVGPVCALTARRHGCSCWNCCAVVLPFSVGHDLFLAVYGIRGDFALVDFQQMFHHMDADCGYRLSEGRFMKKKRQWAQEALQLHVFEHLRDTVAWRKVFCAAILPRRRMFFAL